MHHSPPQMSNSYLINGERPSLSPHLLMSLDRGTLQIKVGLQRRVLAKDWQKYWDVSLFYLHGDTRQGL